MGDLVEALVSPLELWSASFLYGMNFFFFILSLRALFQQPARSTKGNFIWIYIAGVVIQVILATVHVILALVATVSSFKAIEPATSVQNLISNWKFKFTTDTAIIPGINSMFSDLMLVCRIYELFDGQLSYFIPSLISSLLSGALSMYNLSFLVADGIEGGVPNSSAIANLVIKFLTQILLTGLILGKDWWLPRKRGTLNLKEKSPFWLVIESGAILVVVDFLFIIMWGVDFENALNLMLSILAQLSTLVSLIMITRVQSVANAASAAARYSRVQAAASVGVFRPRHVDAKRSSQDT